MLKAMGKRVILKKKDAEVQSAGGIFLGSSQDGSAVYAQVIAVGDEVTTVKVGETVLPDWRTTVPFKHNNENFLLIDERGILGVFEE